MKKKFTLYALIIAVSTFTIGCSSKAVLIQAENGKTYYVDSEICETYKLSNDSMYCYTGNSRCDTVVYKPVKIGCDSQNVCGKTYNLK